MSEIKHHDLAGKARMLTRTSQALQALSLLSYRIGVVLLFTLGISIAVVLNIGVFSRYVMNSPVIWSEELARFLLIWITFVGASVEVYKKEMLSFSFSSNFIPQRAQLLMRLIIGLLTILFLSIFLWFGFSSLSIYKLITASATKMSLIWPAVGMVVGGVFMTIHIVAQAIQDILEHGRGEEEVLRPGCAES